MLSDIVGDQSEDIHMYVHWTHTYILCMHNMHLIIHNTHIMTKMSMNAVNKMMCIYIHTHIQRYVRVSTHIIGL